MEAPTRGANLEPGRILLKDGVSLTVKPMTADPPLLRYAADLCTSAKAIASFRRPAIHQPLNPTTWFAGLPKCCKVAPGKHSL